MKRLDHHFILHRSRSGLFSKHKVGDVPYITNGMSDNGVMGFVAPLPNDKVFMFRGISVSAFCEATVQVPPFIGYGCAGTGITALQPRYAMTVGQLASAAAYINLALRWRFSWYWRVTVSRLERLLLPDTIHDDLGYNIRDSMPTVNVPSVATVERLKPLEIPAIGASLIRYDVKDLIPPRIDQPTLPLQANFRQFLLDDLFELQPGNYHNASELPDGDIPLISCGDNDNGITAFVSVPEEHIFRSKLTIAFNGMNTLTTKFHPYRFAAKDDVAICFPRNDSIRASTLFFIQFMMAREKWRYNYYRKCFMEKLKLQTVALPAKKGGDVDEDTMEALVKSSPYWEFLEKRFAQVA
jgi:hypothetical protein